MISNGGCCFFLLRARGPCGMACRFGSASRAYIHRGNFRRELESVQPSCAAHEENLHGLTNYHEICKTRNSLFEFTVRSSRDTRTSANVWSRRYLVGVRDCRTARRRSPSPPVGDISTCQRARCLFAILAAHQNMSVHLEPLIRCSHPRRSARRHASRGRHSHSFLATPPTAFRHARSY